MGAVMADPPKSNSVAGREQLIEQVAEPGLEHVDLGLCYRHFVGPVIGNGPGRRMLRRRSANATNRRARIVIEVVRQLDLRRGILSSRFASEGHARDLE